MSTQGFAGARQRLAASIADFPIQRRVALVALLPGIAALALAGYKLVQDYGLWTQSRTAAAEISAAGKVSALVHELQKERGLTLSALGNTAGDRSALNAQRKVVDTRRAALADELIELGGESSDDKIVDGIDSLVNRLVHLPALRGEIDAGKVQPKDAAAYYTSPINDFIDYVEAAGRGYGNSDLRDRLVGYSALLRAKEAAGLERGLGAGAIAQGRLSEETASRIAALAAAQDTYFLVMAQHDSGTLAADIRKLQEGAANRAYQANREALLSTAAPAPSGGTAWWQAASTRIDAMHTVLQAGERELIGLASASSEAARVSFVIFAVLLVGLGALIVLLVMLVARGLVRPVQDLAAATEAMTAGNLAVAIPVAETGDELGQLAGRIRQFRDRLVTAEKERAAHEAEREQQVARVAARAARVDALTGSFDQDVGGVLATFAQSTRGLLEAARQLDRKALESAERSAAVASASQQTNNNVRIVAEATEELSLSIEEIVRQVTGTAQGMQLAVAEVRQAHGDMAVLRQAAGEIDSIVASIGDIAEQTNILALNATIEAARAGNEGLGFAVVAAEVRALAVQTGEATRSIAGAIEEMTGKTRRAAEGMDRIAASIQSAEQASTAISAALEQQSMAARQIAQNVQEAACGVAQVDSNIVAIEQASSAQRGEVESVVGAASTFGDRAASLEHSVQDFLTSIRAA